MPLMRVGELTSNAPFGQGANPNTLPYASLVYGNAPVAASSTAKPSATAAAAVAAWSPPPSFAVSLVAPSAAPIAVTPAKSVAPSSGGCGPEPARKAANASGAAQFVDGAAGMAYLACLDRENANAEAARLAALAARSLGGEKGCGPEPAFTMFNGQKQYGTNNAAYGAAWNQCMQSAPTVSRPVPLASPPPVASSGGGNGAPVVYERASSSSSSDEIGPASLTKSAPADLQKSPVSVSGSIDIPTEMWIGLGILGAATVLGGIYLATRQPKRKAA